MNTSIHDADVNAGLSPNIMGGTKKESIVRAGYPEVEFGGFSRVDGTVEFLSRVNALLGPDHVVLDIGCGRGGQAEDHCDYRRELFNLKTRCQRVIGIDVAESGEANPFIDEFRRIDDVNRWPVEDQSVDLALSNYVLEHIEDSDAFFAEAARVVKPGGYICLRTPNAWSYVALVSRLIPNRMHAGVIEKVQRGRKEEDVFPTFYRCNTKGRLQRLLERHSFQSCVYRRQGQPQYLSSSRLAFRCGVFIHRWMPDVFKTTLFAFGRRQA